MLRLVSTSNPRRNGRLVSWLKLLITWGRPSSCSVKSSILRLGTTAPLLSRTVTGKITSRAWTFRVVTGVCGAGPEAADEEVAGEAEDCPAAEFVANRPTATLTRATTERFFERKVVIDLAGQCWALTGFLSTRAQDAGERPLH